MRNTIDMASEAGFNFTGTCDIWCDNTAVLKAFEALVRADERERVMNEPLTKANWQRFEDEIRAGEREECAKVCDRAIGDKHPDDIYSDGQWAALTLAAEIRARGSKE
jgi:hypothetical protein